MLHRSRRSKCKITVWTLIYIGWTMSTVTILVVFLMAVHGQPPDYAKGNAYGQAPILVPGESAAVDVDGMSERESPIVRLDHQKGDKNNFEKDFALGNRVILEQRPVKFHPRLEEDIDSPSFYDNSNNNYGFNARVGYDSESNVDGNWNEGELRRSAWAGMNNSIPRRRSRRRNLATLISETRRFENHRQNTRLMAYFATIETQIQHSGKGGERTDVGPVYQDSVDRKISARSSSGIPVVEDAIFWSREAEKYVPPGKFIFRLLRVLVTYQSQCIQWDTLMSVVTAGVAKVPE